MAENTAARPAAVNDGLNVYGITPRGQRLKFAFTASPRGPSAFVLLSLSSPSVWSSEPHSASVLLKVLASMSGSGPVSVSGLVSLSFSVSLSGELMDSKSARCSLVTLMSPVVEEM